MELKFILICYCCYFVKGDGAERTVKKVMELPFNQYSWLTTHNSFASRVANLSINSQISSVTNQEDSITDQLHVTNFLSMENGVRGLMLDMHDYHGDIWLSRGPSTIFTAFQPAIHVLKEINVFLTQHRNEIVTVFIKDHVTSPNDINKLYNFGKEICTPSCRYGARLK
ncbi:PI-PLC X domain-containing protein At5g67130-like [Vicia villosa]|uniref:PI-PLC X domain-containing protein At5g67130-like n=1 Tax=Vicia villosa TaxID=3911 RepID=UPI00273AA87D|nr:PI-PLC X domain-containing protein At5g67130-like [Vicia villosa]